MNCPNCGKKIEDGVTYCTSCGKSVNSVNDEKPIKEKKSGPNKKAMAVAIGCFLVGLLIVVAVIIAIVAFVFNVMDEVSKKEEFELGFASVPSLYKVMGKEEICSFSSSISSGNSEYEIEYCKVSDKTLNKYIDILKKDYGFKEVDDTLYNREVILNDKAGSLKVIHVIISDNKITYKVE